MPQRYFPMTKQMLAKRAPRRVNRRSTANRLNALQIVWIS